MAEKRVNKRSDEYKSVFGNAAKGGGNHAETADWHTVDEKLTHRLICVATRRGGAVRYGYTRDGGAYALGLYYGEEHVTKYCRPSEDVELFLLTWIEFYEALEDTGGRSPSQR